MNLRHIGIVAHPSVFSATFSFYVEHLSMIVESDDIEKGKFLNTILGRKDEYVRVVKLRSNNLVIELLLFDVNTYHNPCRDLLSTGPTHFAIDVQSASDMYEKLVKKFECISPPALSDNEKFFVFFCKDPAGNFIEMVETL